MNLAKCCVNLANVAPQTLKCCNKPRFGLQHFKNVAATILKQTVTRDPVFFFPAQPYYRKTTISCAKPCPERVRSCAFVSGPDVESEMNNLYYKSDICSNKSTWSHNLGKCYRAAHGRPGTGSGSPKGNEPANGGPHP